jgi:hypothetical protein
MITTLVVLVGIWLVVRWTCAPFCDERRQTRQRIKEGRERVRLHKEQQKQAEERLYRDCMALAHYESYGLAELTDEGIAVFCNPN